MYAAENTAGDFHFRWEMADAPFPVPSSLCAGAEAFFSHSMRGFVLMEWLFMQ